MSKLYKEDLNQYKNWFKEASRLLGTVVQYQYVKDKQIEKSTGETVYSIYSDYIEQSVIIENGLPKIDTLKQLGWFVDTTEEQLIVCFATDTPNLQTGCKFKFISNINENQTKEYIIIKMSNELLYPSCIKCLCNPVLTNDSYIQNDQNIQYGKQEITADNENFTYINSEAKLTSI